MAGGNRTASACPTPTRPAARTADGNPGRFAGRPLGHLGGGNGRLFFRGHSDGRGFRSRGRDGGGFGNFSGRSVCLLRGRRLRTPRFPAGLPASLGNGPGGNSSLFHFAASGPRFTCRTDRFLFPTFVLFHQFLHIHCPASRSTRRRATSCGTPCRLQRRLVFPPRRKKGTT